MSKLMDEHFAKTFAAAKPEERASVVAVFRQHAQAVAATQARIAILRKVRDIQVMCRSQEEAILCVTQFLKDEGVGDE